MNEQYEEAIRWLSVMREHTSADNERAVIEYIMEILWRNKDMSNS